MTTDAYYTKPDVARAIVIKLLEYGDIQPGECALDPCVGKGAFANALRSIDGISVTTIDEDPSVCSDITANFLGRHWLIERRWNVITSNPPFSLWQKFVERSVEVLDPRGTVAFLLRLGVLGRSLKQNRAEFLRNFPITTVDVLRPRPTFVGSGADNSEYALFRWCPQDFGTSKATLGFLDWERTPRTRKPKPEPKPRKSRKPAAQAAE